MSHFEWADKAIPCPSCSAPLTDIVEGESVSCRQCALTVAYEELDEALQLAYDAATYGYLYPKAEGREDAQRRKERYSLITEPYLVWLALAALGGIVGNLSYDVVKAAMRRLLGAIKRIPIIAEGKKSLVWGSNL